MKEEGAVPVIPRWYQDLSISQMQKIFALGDIIRADYHGRVTERTQLALNDIGITSTFVKIIPKQIRELRRLADLDPVKFLCEIYRTITGTFFQDEGYKKVYDCNERIILSAIAFLLLPETVIELHRRIPMKELPVFPPKPTPPKPQPRRKKTDSPYLDTQFNRPDWVTYKRDLHLWIEQIKATPIPKSILPPSSDYCRNRKTPPGISTIFHNEKLHEKNTKNPKILHEETNDEKKDNRNEEDFTATKKDKSNKNHFTETKKDKSNEKHFTETKKDKSNEKHFTETKKDKLRKKNFTETKKHYSNKKDFTKSRKDNNFTKADVKDQEISENKFKFQERLQKSEFKSAGYESQSGILEDSGNKSVIIPSDYRINRPRPKIKSWLGEKDTHLILSGTIENNDSPDCPVSFETCGLAYVTPENSDESFFTALNISDCKKKTYPHGRENLSRKWQEWLCEVDEDYMRAKKQANAILKSVEATLKLMRPEVSCDNCCSCRQTRKANIQYHKTKTPRAVIDSVIVDGKGNKYVVGSLSMNSPAPSPSESTTDLPEIIASHDNIIKTKIISGVTNDEGETKFYVSGVTKEIEHVPKKIISNSTLLKPIKNVPPCGCAIEKAINEGLSAVASDDNIPCSKNEQMCIGKKYRPQEGGGIDCKEYPNDKSCRRNPFKKKLDEKIMAAERAKKNSGKKKYPPEEKNMYSLAEFQPCGDGDGMAVCGGPWGAVNVPDEEELARRAAEEKLILQSPPCGSKPGLQICGAPFGERHPIPKKKKKKDDDEDEDEEEEEEEEEEEVDQKELKERRKRERENRKQVGEEKIEKSKNRDKSCVTVRPNFEDAAQSLAGNRIFKKGKDRKKKKSSKEISTSKKSEFKKPSISEVKRKHSQSNRSPSNASTKGRKRKSREERVEIKDPAEEVKALKDNWNRMKRLAGKFVPTPIVIPEGPPVMCKREELSDCCADSYCKDSEEVSQQERESESTKKIPFGLRTKSEELLPVEKTLVYLVDPEKPVENVKVRPGGKPCVCRENRNKRKVLLYNITGTVKEGKGKADKNSSVIDGLIYITPEPSVRNSEEYIPEYELYDSPYEKCFRERVDENFKYLERYLGPKSLMLKKPRARKPCHCAAVKDKEIKPLCQKLEENDANRTEEERKELINNEPAGSFEKKLARALRDEGLMQFYSCCRDNIPCWIRCSEFNKDGCCKLPRTLQVKKPVCECKYERKIVKREEEKTNWLRRQERLKAAKKKPYGKIEGVSRSMVDDTKLVISNVESKMKEVDKDNEDITYCVTGIAQERIMGPEERILSGIGMHTPVVTPEKSKINLRISNFNRDLSPMNIYGSADNSKYLNPANSKRFPNRTGKGFNVLQMNQGASDVQFTSDRLDTNRGDENKVLETHRAGREKEGKMFYSGSEKIQHPRESRSDRTVTAAPRNLRSNFRETRRESREVTTGEIDKSSGDHGKSSIALVENENASKGKMKGSTDKINLKNLLQSELAKMANEGFLFAKLPACHLMPQLQYWIMYREGMALTPEVKLNLYNRSVKIWTDVEQKKPQKLKAPELQEPEGGWDNLTYNKVDKIKSEIVSKKATFYSKLRKARVLQSRTMWGLMEFGKFPGISFKKAYFAYQPCKESDGFVFKPWKQM